MPRSDPVDGVGIFRDPNAVAAQLLAESYRPRTGDRRRCAQLREPLGQLLGTVDGGLPESLAVGPVERREDLAPVAVEHRQPLALGAGLGDPAGQRVEAADAARRQTAGGGDPARRRDPDPQPGERAGPEPDRDQVDGLPASGRLGRPLNLGEQAGRVLRPPLWREAEQRLVQDLAVAPGTGGGVGGRGVEADDDQRALVPSS